MDRTNKEVETRSKTTGEKGSNALPAVPPNRRHTLEQLLSLEPRAVGDFDIALMNLLCATGLPGAEELDIPQCLATLDRWTDAVRRYTRDGSAEYQRNPDHYHRHKGFFCFASMVTLLKHPRGLGVSYEPAAIGNYDFSDSRHDLLHGVLTRRRGTCTSLPVLFVAIARRLQWPIYLAIAKRHVICQWVNPDGGRVNLEGSCHGGGELHPDTHYHGWPHPLTKDDLASGRYLRPLTPPEELALFLETRGHCLVDNKRFAEAREAYAHARRFAPDWSQYHDHICSLELHESIHKRGSPMRPTPPSAASWRPSIVHHVSHQFLFPEIAHYSGVEFGPEQ